MSQPSSAIMNRIYLTFVDTNVEKNRMHSKLFRAHFVSRARKMNFQRSVHLILHDGPMNMNIRLIMIFRQTVKFSFNSTK